ncbi:unnamed protein product [Candidula unifasciata]|uniref:HSac2 domain-containing protein n=1 Tax=Candidula unifasciata TaxID=100452 RepID=A0A8S4A3U2_9EUPU|nr:unnamed protein product [Candidula unifasciata]
MIAEEQQSSTPDGDDLIHDPAVLDDDQPATVKEYQGATLQIGSEDNVEDDTPEVLVCQPSVGSGLSRSRPGSVIGGSSVRSTASRISMRPGRVQTEVSARSFYCYKESHFERAVNDVKSIIKPELDGELRSSWLLTEIDHWDFEREKIILLTDNSMFVVKYNFINEKLYEYRRIMLHVIHSICIGDFIYPNASLMPERKHGGIQIRFDRGEELSFGQKWNPWCSDIPWVTLSHHPLIYNPKETETTTYNVDEFFETIVAETSKVFTAKRPKDTLKVIEGPIKIETYASPVSLVFNQSAIGFFRDRNGVSF